LAQDAGSSTQVLEISSGQCEDTLKNAATVLHIWLG